MPFLQVAFTAPVLARNGSCSVRWNSPAGRSRRSTVSPSAASCALTLPRRVSSSPTTEISTSCGSTPGISASMTSPSADDQTFSGG
jgi:hypothetical protein